MINVSRLRQAQGPAGAEMVFCFLPTSAARHVAASAVTVVVAIRTVVVVVIPVVVAARASPVIVAPIIPVTAALVHE
ncbi:hypothetical protein [Mycobacterium sp.]|uniref:hypothetical protein n=1 Tax=Mycobacterium sp. TaxID=1785 RepID=UPI002D1FB858|nr:hypothetical protein [Mycobacterium sp.]